MFQVIKSVTKAISSPTFFDFPVARVLEAPKDVLFQKIIFSSLI